jgi:hypothetical protein
VNFHLPKFPRQAECAVRVTCPDVANQSIGSASGSPVKLVGRILLCGVLSLISLNAFAAGKKAVKLCDIKVDPRMSLYMVMTGDKPYKEKRYLTWDDALRLRDFLVSAGECKRAAPAKSCKVELLTAGAYAVMRDGVSFDPYAKLRTLEAAHRFAAQLAKVRLCKPIRR